MKKIRYVSEILLALVLIVISYFAWDRVDVLAYEKYITQYNVEDIDVFLDHEFEYLVYVSDKESVNASILNVNNYQNKVYDAKVFLELEGVSTEIIDNLLLVIDDNQYCLNDIFAYKSGNKFYFLIANVSLDEYEKESYNLKLLVNDNYEFNDYDVFSYNIIEEIF